MSSQAAEHEALRLTPEQATDVAMITACVALREKLLGWGIAAHLQDSDGLARVLFIVMDIAQAVMLREDGVETEDEARELAIGWLNERIEGAAVRLAESGAVFNPEAAVLSLG